MNTAVKVLRKSTNDPSELVNQDMVINPFIREKGWQVVCTETLLDTPRWSMMQQAERLLAKLKELKPTYLVYRDHDRIGFEGVGELGWFVTELRRLGISIWLAKDNMPLNMNDEGTMFKVVAGQMASDREISTKGYRTQLGRRKIILNKSSAGKSPAYGYDHAVYDREGKLKYRLIYEGYQREEGKHESKTTPDYWKPNLALHRLKLYPDGTIEQYNDRWTFNKERNKYELEKNRPVLENGERKFEVINKERAAVVKEIYRLADTPLWWTTAEIAAKLNKDNIPPIRSRKWTFKSIEHILTNPLYKGEPVDNRTTTARTTRVYNDVIPIPLSEEERNAIRIISPDRWQRVNEHLIRPSTPIVRRKKTNLSNFWLRGYMVCAGCGLPFTVSSQQNGGTYICKTCGCIKAAVVHELINKWLLWLEEHYKQLTDNHPYDRTETHQRLDELTNSLHKSFPVAGHMWKFVLDNLPGTIEERIAHLHQRWPNLHLPNTITEAEMQDIFVADPDHYYSTVLPPILPPILRRWYTAMLQDKRIVEVYTEVFEEVNKPLREQVAALDREIDELFSLSFQSAEMRERADRKAVELEGRKKELEKKLVSLVPEYHAALKKIADAADKVKQLKTNVFTASGENKAVLLSGFLERVEVHFDKTAWPCTLSKVAIHAKDNTIPMKVFAADECRQVWKSLYKVRRRVALQDKDN